MLAPATAGAAPADCAVTCDEARPWGEPATGAASADFTVTCDGRCPPPGGEPLHRFLLCDSLPLVPSCAGSRRQQSGAEACLRFSSRCAVHGAPLLALLHMPGLLLVPCARFVHSPTSTLHWCGVNGCSQGGHKTAWQGRGLRGHWQRPCHGDQAGKGQGAAGRREVDGRTRWREVWRS